MKLLRLIALVATLALGACATVTTQIVELNPKAEKYPPTQSVEVLLQKPQRPYTEIAFLESKGGSEAHLLNDARAKAAALGAHAVVKLETEKEYYPPVAIYDPWYDPFFFGYHRFRPFPPYPHPWGPYQVVGGGFSYVLKTVAIRYSD